MDPIPVSPFNSINVVVGVDVSWILSPLIVKLAIEASSDIKLLAVIVLLELIGREEVIGDKNLTPPVPPTISNLDHPPYPKVAANPVPPMLRILRWAVPSLWYISPAVIRLLPSKSTLLETTDPLIANLGSPKVVS